MPRLPLLIFCCVTTLTSAASAQFGFFGPPFFGPPPPFFGPPAPLFGGVRLQRAYPLPAVVPVLPYGHAPIYGDYLPYPPSLALGPYGSGGVSIRTPGFSLDVPSPVASAPPVYANPYGYSDGSYDAYAYSDPVQALPIEPYGYDVPPAQSYLPPDVSTGPLTLTRELAIDRLRLSAARLAAALSTRSDAEGWIDYLQPTRITELLPAIEAGDLAAWSELRGLEINYAGVMQNDTLVWLRQTDGFAGTRSALANLLEYEPQPIVVPDALPPIDLDGPEELPTPRRERA